MTKKEPFFWITISCGFVIMAFILLPLIEMITAPHFRYSGRQSGQRCTPVDLVEHLYRGTAVLISFVFGTRLAYLLAERTSPAKRLVESIIDLPIVIPHPVVGVAILSIAGRNYWLGQIFSELGIRIMGSVTGIVTVLTFVGMPFYINAVKEGFEGIFPRLEKVFRSWGIHVRHLPPNHISR